MGLRHLLGLGGLFLLLSGLSSCTTARLVRYFAPNITDHKIFPCDTLKPPPGDKAIFTYMPTELPPIEQWISKDHLLGQTELQAYLKRSSTTSLIIAQSDTILFEAYPGNQKAEDFRTVFSVTKAIVAMLTAIAVEEGHIRLDQPVSDFIPEFGRDARRQITIRHLLNMTCGINWADYKNIAWLGVLYYNTNQARFLVKRTKLKYKPGAHFDYKSITTQILTVCLERAIKRKPADYLQEKIWTPLNMEFPAVFTYDSKKHHSNRGFGGLAMTSRDMLRIGLLLLQGGRWGDKQILPAWFIRQLNYRQMESDSWWGYSNCFWRDGYQNANFLEDQDFFAAGFHGQTIYVNPRYNMVMIRQGEKDHEVTWPVQMGRLAKLLHEGKNELVDSHLSFDEQFEGVYETRRGERFEVIYNGKDELGIKTWALRKDVRQTTLTKQLMVLKQYDGYSLGFKKFGKQIRAIFRVEGGRVVGLYFDDSRTIDLAYFEKTSSLPLRSRRELSLLSEKKDKRKNNKNKSKK